MTTNFNHFDGGEQEWTVPHHQILILLTAEADRL